MSGIAEMAGFFAAHGIWSVSGGATLIPLLGYLDTDGNRGMDRLVADDAADAARSGQEALEAGRPGWVRAVLVVDTYLHLDRGRTDALVIDAIEYFPARQSMKLAIPYRPRSTSQGFAVYRPKFIGISGISEPDWGVLGTAFYTGVDSHEPAAAVWNAHLLDESA
jgi:hypothetical protein